MTSREEVIRDKIKFPAKGSVFVQTLKKNISVKCLVIRVGKINSTVEIRGVEAKVPNDQVWIDDQDFEEGMT
jgi:hypothetical protein